MAAFRESVAASFLFKFYLSVLLDLANECRTTDPSGSEAPWPPVAPVPDSDLSAAVDSARPVSTAVQTFDVPLGADDGTPGGAPGSDPVAVAAAVGAPIPHASALLQVGCLLSA